MDYACVADTLLTYQILGGAGYRFKHFDMVAGYR
jgi:hypothetical protein